jgi:hypothetical protein
MSALIYVLLALMTICGVIGGISNGLTMTAGLRAIKVKGN